MAVNNRIRVSKPAYKSGEFVQFSRKAFAELNNRTKSKTVVALWVFLAGNADGFEVTVAPKCVESLWGLDKGKAENICRALGELKELGYINEEGVFSEYGWNLEKKEGDPILDLF